MSSGGALKRPPGWCVLIPACVCLTAHLLGERFPVPPSPQQLTAPQAQVDFYQTTECLMMGIYCHICISTRRKGRNSVLSSLNPQGLAFCIIVTGEYLLIAWMNEWFPALYIKILSTPSWTVHTIIIDIIIWYFLLLVQELVLINGWGSSDV